MFVLHAAAGIYGNFAPSANGGRSYLANTTLTAIQFLGAGQTLTDSFTATTAGGPAQVVTINGADKPGLGLELSSIAAGDVKGDGFDQVIIGGRSET